MKMAYLMLGCTIVVPMIMRPNGSLVRYQKRPNHNCTNIWA